MMLTDIAQEPGAIDALLRMIEHRAIVRQQMRQLAHALLEAADAHDLSKFGPDEFLGFVRFADAVRGLEFGSPEYEEALKAHAGVIQRHHIDNPHHPEYHPFGGVKVMNLVELIEMVADWGAAAATYRQGKSFGAGLKRQAERHNLDEEQLRLVWLIRDALAEIDPADMATWWELWDIEEDAE